MNPNMPSSGRVDVLSTIRRHAESHRAAAETDAYSAQEAPRLETAYSAVAELIAADREYDAACSELSEQENADDDDELYLSAVRRHQWARDRRAAAFANIGAAP